MPDRINLKELPRQNSPDYFRLLVRNCIETYRELPSDALCLDYNMVSGKFRAMVLDDEEYRRETRNIYAKQRLRELQDLNDLTKLAMAGEEDSGDGERGIEECDPRNRGRKAAKPAKPDKDDFAMRFKAAQMRRELVASLNENNAASERDMASFMFVGMPREDVEKNAWNEIHEGDPDDKLEGLASPKEEAPEGTSGKTRPGKRTGPADDREFFDTLPDGEIIER